MPTSTPSLDQLQRALAIAEQIQTLEQELASVLGGPGGGSSATSSPAAAPVARQGKKGKRVVSPEARARMAQAQAARWAKVRGISPASSTAALDGAASKSKNGRKKRQLSPEGRARIVAALKARHAAKRKAKGA